MAILSLNSNLPALQAAQSLETATTNVSSLFERLSSGTRINHASDDPAGLAEASLLNTSGRVYTQATRNVNDSISFFNVAESATSALKNILDRMGELATQASNGVLSDTQRQALDEESQALQAEYGRILTTAKFNDTNVFTTGDMATQAGFGAKAVILANISSGSSTTITITTTGTDTITTTTTTTTTTTKGDGTFQARQTFGTGNHPRLAAVDDFNGDGNKDLVITNDAANTASVLLGNGNGTFKAKQDFTTGSQPWQVAVNDFNGDGKSDLVIADYNAGTGNTASVLLGNGNGTFKAKQDFTAGSGSAFVAVNDLDGDSNKDVVILNYNGNTASVLLGNGNGTFKAKQDFGTATNPCSVALADLNGDGKNDLVVSNEGSTTASVLLGNGNGTFKAKQDFGTGSGPHVVLADLDDDGKLDLVSADYFTTTASVLLGNGNGTFKAKQSFTTAANAGSVVVGDFNGDSKSDLSRPPARLRAASSFCLATATERFRPSSPLAPEQAGLTRSSRTISTATG